MRVTFPYNFNFYACYDEVGSAALFNHHDASAELTIERLSDHPTVLRQPPTFKEPPLACLRSAGFRVEEEQ